MTQRRGVVAEPRLLVRQSLCAAIAARGTEVVADVADARALVAATGQHHPDVAVITTHLWDDSVPDLADRVRAEHGCRLLVIGHRAHQAELLQALESGADGFLPPTAPLADLGRALDQIGAGDTYIPPGMLSGLLRELINRRRDDDAVLRRFSRLSRREREVLRLIAAGASLQEMASLLYLSHHTVRTHVQNVIGKLEVHSRVEAASMVVEYDLIGRFNEEGSPS
jgi:DNA-binding NarL/FixJ family response regulator